MHHNVIRIMWPLIFSNYVGYNTYNTQVDLLICSLMQCQYDTDVNIIRYIRRIWSIFHTTSCCMCQKKDHYWRFFWRSRVTYNYVRWHKLLNYGNKRTKTFVPWRVILRFATCLIGDYKMYITLYFQCIYHFMLY